MAIERTIALLGATALIATGWFGAHAAPATYMYTLMLNIVGPPAMSLREMAGSTALSDRDWEQLRPIVRRLRDSAPLVSTGGTSTEDMQRAETSEWRRWSGMFAQTTAAAADAVERKDQVALKAANNALVQACSGCHMAFAPGAAL